MVGRLFDRLSHEGIPGRPWEITVYQLLLKGHVFAWHIHSWRKNWISSLVGCSCQFLPSSKRKRGPGMYFTGRQQPQGRADSSFSQSFSVNQSLLFLYPESRIFYPSNIEGVFLHVFLCLLFPLVFSPCSLSLNISLLHLPPFNCVYLFFPFCLSFLSSQHIC